MGRQVERVGGRRVEGWEESGVTGLMGAGNRSVEEPGTLQVLRQEVFRAQPLQAAEGCHATGDSQETGEKRGKWKQLPTSEKSD